MPLCPKTEISSAFFKNLPHPTFRFQRRRTSESQPYHDVDSTESHNSLHQTPENTPYLVPQTRPQLCGVVQTTRFERRHSAHLISSRPLATPYLSAWSPALRSMHRGQNTMDLHGCSPRIRRHTFLATSMERITLTMAIPAEATLAKRFLCTFKHPPVRKLL